jgi:hypothetical protein
MISDEALMLEFQGGSQQAFEELFARYRGLRRFYEQPAQYVIRRRRGPPADYAAKLRRTFFHKSDARCTYPP